VAVTDATHDAVDAQIHVFAPDEREHPWSNEALHGEAFRGMRSRYAGRSARPAEIIATLDANNVRGALLVTPMVYGLDNAYALEAYALAPDRFRVVALLDMIAADVAQAVDAWAAHAAAVGIRLSLYAEDAIAAFFDGAYDRALAAAQQARLPVFVNAPGRFDVFERIAQRFDALQLVIDHLGLFDVAMLEQPERDKFAAIGSLLPLARYANVAVKVTSVPLLSREPYPHADAWPHLRAVIDAFGVERLLWGSDAFIFDHPYDEAIEFIRSSDEVTPHEKAMLLGGALRRVLRWD